MTSVSLNVRATIVSLLVFLAFVLSWHLATQGTGTAAKMDPEYAKLMGMTATQGKSAMPGPLEVGAKIWSHLSDPFYDRGTNDKGIGIQLAYSIARVLLGYLIAVAVALPIGFLIGMSPLMNRALDPFKLLDIKRERAWTWKHITDEIGGMSPVSIVGALLGQHRLVKPLAKKAADLFGLSVMEERMLNEVPYRGTGTPMPPTDPLIYRFYELVLVNGPAWKALIEEEYGDGIMSAIDFDMNMERLPNEKGDRVKITMSGKFLPFKYYDNEQGIPAYGFKETS